MNRLRIVLGLALALTSTLIAVADEPRVFTYKLDGFPHANPNCHLAATEAGAIFSQANPEVTVQSAICLAQNNDGYDLEIKYLATERVALVSTTENTPTALSGPGRFKTLESCMARIENDSRHFEEATGLTPSFAFCTREKYSSRIPYALRIDAFGAAKLAAFVSDYPIFALPESLTGEAYVNTLVDQLAARGVNVLSVVSHSGLAMGYIAVHYFAESRVRFHSDELTKVPLTAQCEAQVDEARTALQSSANPPLLVYCARPGITGVSELTVVFADAPTFRNTPSVEKFDTYESCEASRRELLEFYIGTLGRPVLGGFCSRIDRNEYRLQLFEENVR